MNGTMADGAVFPAETTLKPAAQGVEAGSRDGGARLRVKRTRRLTLGSLTHAERAVLCSEAYAIYVTYKTGVDRATFDRAFFSDDAARVALFYGEDGAFAGFACAAVKRVSHQGKDHAVYSALLFVDTRYSGAREASIFAITEALRFKLREPRTPLAYMGVVTTPASYRAFGKTMPTFFPSWRAPTPAGVDALAREAARARGLTFVDEDRWLVKSLGKPRCPERLRSSQRLKDDPDARFYLDHNPRFDDGTSLLIWVPLDVANLGRALVRQLVAAVR